MANTFKKLIVLLAGSSVLLLGIVLLFLPGPALLVIPLGLAILATEFAWAKKALHKVSEYAKQFKKKKTVK